MEIRVVTPPAPLVTLAEAKVHLRVDHNDDDAFISGLIGAASGYMDGPMGWLGRAIGHQELEVIVPEFCDDHLWLSCPPIISVESVKYLNTTNVEEVVAPANYSWDEKRLWLAADFRFPGVFRAWNAVRIAFTAGYAEVPEQLKVAVKMHVGTLYESRETVGDAKEILPHAYEALCAPYKVWAL